MQRDWDFMMLEPQNKAALAQCVQDLSDAVDALAVEYACRVSSCGEC